MPGLLRGMARTAVVAGTAAHVAGNVQHRQQQKWAQQDATQTQDYSAPQDQSDQLEQLERLGQLKQSGVLTEAEFEAKKREILGT